MILRRGRLGECSANPERRTTGMDRGIGRGKRPAPETERGVTLKITRHAAVLENVVRHDPEGSTDSFQKADQVTRFVLDPLTEST